MRKIIKPQLRLLIHSQGKIQYAYSELDNVCIKIIQV